MAHSHTRRWLHRIGYVTTTLVALQLALISFFAVRERLQERAMRGRFAEANRTHDGPVVATGPKYGIDETDLLARLPSLTSFPYLVGTKWFPVRGDA